MILCGRIRRISCIRMIIHGGGSMMMMLLLLMVCIAAVIWIGIVRGWRRDEWVMMMSVLLCGVLMLSATASAMVLLLSVMMDV